MDVTYIQSINGTNYISTNDDKICIRKYYAPFLPSKNNEDVSSGPEYDSTKWRIHRNKKNILDLLLNKSRSFEWQVSLLLFVINGTKLSLNMDEISEHINSSNHVIYSHDQMCKNIVNLSNQKCENNNKPTGHLNQIQKLLLMSIVDTPEKYVSNVDRK